MTWLPTAWLSLIAASPSGATVFAHVQGDGSLALDPLAVYTVLQNEEGADVARIPKRGGAPETLAHFDEIACGPVADRDGVYVVACKPPRLMFIPTSKGPSQPLADVESCSCADIALDDDSVWWIANGTLRRSAKHQASTKVIATIAETDIAAVERTRILVTSPTTARFIEKEHGTAAPLARLRNIVGDDDASWFWSYRGNLFRTTKTEVSSSTMATTATPTTLSATPSHLLLADVRRILALPKSGGESRVLWRGEQTDEERESSFIGAMALDESGLYWVSHGAPNGYYDITIWKWPKPSLDRELARKTKRSRIEQASLQAELFIDALADGDIERLRALTSFPFAWKDELCQREKATIADATTLEKILDPECIPTTHRAVFHLKKTSAGVFSSALTEGSCAENKIVLVFESNAPGRVRMMSRQRRYLCE